MMKPPRSKPNKSDILIVPAVYTFIRPQPRSVCYEEHLCNVRCSLDSVEKEVEVLQTPIANDPIAVTEYICRVGGELALLCVRYR